MGTPSQSEPGTKKNKEVTKYTPDLLKLDLTMGSSLMSSSSHNKFLSYSMTSKNILFAGINRYN